MHIGKFAAALLISLAAVFFAGASGAYADPDEKASFSYVSVAVSSDLTLCIGARVDESVTAPSMSFSGAGKEELVYGTKDGELWKFEYCGIYSQYMSDAIQIKLMDGSSVLAEREYSLQQYFDGLYESGAAQLGLDEKQFSALKRLLADILEYGTMAQYYSDTLTSKPANALSWVSSEKSGSVPAPVSDADITIPGTSTDCIKSVSVCLSNSVRLKLNVKAEYADRLIIEGGGRTEEIMLSTCPVTDGVYRVCLRALSASEFDTVWGITLADSDRLYYSRVEYSVNSYIAAKYYSKDLKLARLVRAMYCYGVSADMYRLISDGNVLSDDHEWGAIS